MELTVSKATGAKDHLQGSGNGASLNKFDLIVIGTGSAASTVAYECNSWGWKVAVVDERQFGGTCALRGCDPKKVLVGAAEIVDSTNRMGGSGIKGDTAIDWQQLMKFKRSFTDPVPKNREESFRKAGISAYHGSAHFTGKNTVAIDGSVTEQLAANQIVIATGAKPMKLDIEGEDHLTISDEFLELDSLPKDIVFVGGGYISFEFAHISARAGAKATILHRGERPLEKFDQDLVEMLLDKTRELGIDVLLQTDVKKIEKDASGRLRVHAGSKVIEADMVVHGSGRIPNIDSLDLEKGGVEFDRRRGIKVNQHLQSVSNPVVYAAGDVDASDGGLALTPVASYDGRIVTANLRDQKKSMADYRGIPSVVYTIPPLATVGMTETFALESGLKFKTNKAATQSWYSSRRIGETHSGFKVLIEEGSEKILGAHLFGPQAEEVINIFAIAIRLGLKASDLRNAIWSYPTNSSDISYMI